MSTLGDAVKKDLAVRGLQVDSARIEKILLNADVSSTASRGKHSARERSVLIMASGIAACDWWC